MTTLPFLAEYLKELLDTPKIVDYCPNGVQVEGCNKIFKIATAVTASQKAIEAAVECGPQALIVHHGLFWNKDDYAITGVKREKIKLLLDHQISLLAYHLPLDAHRDFGNNWKAAKDLGWENLEPFYFSNGVFYGVKGTIKAVSKEEFQRKLEAYYGHPAYCAFGGKPIIKTAALVSGGAHRQISDAVKEGVDCYITGSFDEPVWHIAEEEKINFYALGHAATEKIGPRALGDHLKEKLSLEHRFLDIANPF
jgi:dinuclear metal center YbgI/SA1388 family protein